jgi:hypothetical protein
VAEEPLSPQRLNRTLGPYIEGVLRKGLAKKPGNRYRTCAEFVGSLETTCASTKGWAPMARGASLNLSTMAGVKQGIPDPPAQKRPPRKEKEQERKSSKILPLAAAFLMVVGVFSLLTWQGREPAPEGQAVTPKQEEPARTPAPEEPRPTAKEPAIDKDTSEPAIESKPDAETPPPAPVVRKAATKPVKPSPMHSSNEGEIPAPRPSAKAQAQDVSVSSYPSGAKAIIDGGDGPSCTTPCTLEVPPGRHSLSLRLDGYQEERRDLRIGSDAQEEPLISLRKSAGVLMITTVPEGATITINNKLQNQKTPAQINLPPDTYTITVDKDGRRAVNRVDIRNGNTEWLRIKLE